SRPRYRFTCPGEMHRHPVSVARTEANTDEIVEASAPGRRSTVARCHPLKRARWGPICANVDGIARRKRKSPGIKCRVENCVQPLAAVKPLRWRCLNHRRCVG